MIKPSHLALPLDPTPEELERWLEATTAFVVDHVRRLPDMPSFGTEGAPAATAALLEPPPEHGRSLEEAFALLRPALEASDNTVRHGDLQFIPGCGVSSAVIADQVA